MKKLLLAIVFVICFSGVANAEGTWILWEGTMELDLPIKWKILNAFRNYEQCIEKHKENFEIIKESSGNMGFQTHLLSEDTIVVEKVHAKDSSGDVIITHKCLPDTVDPRKQGGKD